LSGPNAETIPVGPGQVKLPTLCVKD